MGGLSIEGPDELGTSPGMGELSIYGPLNSGPLLASGAHEHPSV